MKRMGAVAIATMVSFGAHAQAPPDWKAKWDAALEKSKGQSLVISVHSQDGYAASIRPFQRKFPNIKVSVTEIIPDAMVTRVLNEQKNNVYAWDVMWASTTNMNSSLIPAGAFQDFEPFLLLPEVADPSNWNAPDYQWTTPKAKQIFINSLYTTNLAFQNMDNSNGFRVTKLEDLVDPRLKGKIGIRDPYHANGGTWTFGAFYKLGGREFVKRYFSDMDLVVNMNPRQAADAVMRGDLAIGTGITTDVISRCKRAGGCKAVEPLPFGEVMGTRGVAVFKNAPNKAAAIVFINWFLSKEGQAVHLAEFARLNESGAVSRRKDVPPPGPEHLATVPDYAHLDKAFIPGMDDGNKVLEEAMKLYADIKGGPR